MTVHSAWLAGNLALIATYAPKDFPRSSAELLPKPVVAAAEPQTPQQWAAIFSQITGKPVAIDRPQEA